MQTLCCHFNTVHILCVVKKKETFCNRSSEVSFSWQLHVFVCRHMLLVGGNSWKTNISSAWFCPLQLCIQTPTNYTCMIHVSTHTCCFVSKSAHWWQLATLSCTWICHGHMSCMGLWHQSFKKTRNNSFITFALCVLHLRSHTESSLSWYKARIFTCKYNK